MNKTHFHPEADQRKQNELSADSADYTDSRKGKVNSLNWSKSNLCICGRIVGKGREHRANVRRILLNSANPRNLCIVLDAVSSKSPMR